MMVWPVIYPNSGLATANMLLAASVAVPGRPSGISLNASLDKDPLPPGMPKAIFEPSGAVTNAHSSFRAVNHVKI